MPPESWLVLTVAAAFLLLGVAGSPLAWVLLHHRRSQSEQMMEQRCRKLADEVRGLEKRVNQLESAAPAAAMTRGRARPGLLGERGSVKAGSSGRRGSVRVDRSAEPPLIAVPSLAAAPSDRDAALNGLKERHAVIWALADSGASPEAIARTTGQPIGQIELVLGLRRQIDGTRATFSHPSHE